MSCPGNKIQITHSVSIFYNSRKMEQKHKEIEQIKLTKGGRHSSACRLSTENPQCLLVTDAVSVLQKECT